MILHNSMCTADRMSERSIINGQTYGGQSPGVLILCFNIWILHRLKIQLRYHNPASFIHNYICLFQIYFIHSDLIYNADSVRGSYIHRSPRNTPYIVYTCRRVSGVTVLLRSTIVIVCGQNGRKLG